MPRSNRSHASSRGHALPSAPAKTASILVRLSKAASDENLSLDGMLADCRALADREGLTVVSEHVDDGLSGAIRNRPGFIAWLDDARECRAGTLIAWHVDRMTREGINVAARILDAVEGKDPDTGKVIREPARLVDTRGLDSRGDETSFRLRFVINAEVARGERERMRDRSRVAHRRALTAGRWPGGRPPYGFQVVDNPDGPGKVLALHPQEAAFIREAGARVLAGDNLSVVVRWANGPDGHPPRTATSWARNSLDQILTGPAAAGEVTTTVEGRSVPLLDSDGHVVTIPAILTPDESAALRARLSVRNPNAAKGGRHPSRLLSGVITCSGCNGKLGVSRRTNASVLYRCKSHSHTCVCDTPVAVSALPLEEYVTRVYLDSVGSHPAYVRRAEVSGAAAVAAAQEAVSEALAALAGSPTDDAVTRYREACEARDEALTVPQETQVRLVPTGRTLAEQWEVSGVHERRAMLQSAYLTIVILPGRRGRTGLDPARVRMAAPPAFVLDDDSDVDAYRHDRVVQPAVSSPYPPGE